MRWTHGTGGVLLALLLLPLSQALGGGFGTPSEMGGLWQVTYEPGVHLVSFPLLPDNATLEQVLGDHFPGGPEWATSTRLVTIEDGVYHGAFYSSTLGQWTGDLDSLHLTKAYWLIIPEGAAPVQFRLIGTGLEADTVRMGEIEPGLNMVAAPMPYPVSLSASGLEGSGLHRSQYAPLADRLYAWADDRLAPAWASGSSGWAGATFTFHPEAGYLLWRSPAAGPLHWRAPRPSGFEGWGGSLEGGTEVELSPALAAIAPPLPDFSRPPWEARVPKPESHRTRGAR